MTPALATVSGLLLADDVLLVHGRVGAALTGEVTVALEGDAAGGVGWCQSGPPTDLQLRGFVGLFRVPDAARSLVEGLRLQPVDLPAAEPLSLPPLSRLGLDCGPLADTVEGTGIGIGRVLGLLVAALLDRGGMGILPPPRVRSFLRDFLLAAGRPRGFIELLGRPECGGVLVQGWMADAATQVRPDGPEGSQAILELEDGALEAVAMHLADFPRQDVLHPAIGILGFARTAGDLDPARIRCLHLAAGGRLARLEVALAHRVLLESEAATLHLRRSLPVVRGGAGAMRAFRRACRPRFAGVDTLAASLQPVRAGMDLVLPVGESGFLLAGWLLDPERRVERVLLKSDSGFYARLDQSWTRRPRPDVTEGYERSPVFAGRLRGSDHRHGFIVLTPREPDLPAGQRLYLEIVLEDGNCLFLPIAIESEREPFEAFRELIAAVAADDPVLEELAQRHLAPAAGMLLSSRRLPDIVTELPLGPEDSRRPRISLIVTVRALEEVPALLAMLAEDAMARSGVAELLLVVVEADAHTFLGRGRHLAAFHGLRARLLVVAGAALGLAESMAIGAGRAAGDQLLFLAAGALPDTADWLERALAGFDALPARSAMSPTTLHVDRTPRYAGSSLPGIGLRHRQASGPQAATDLAAECLMIRRDTLAAAGGIPRDVYDPAQIPAVLAGRLRAAGGACYWLPDVRMIVVDPPEAVGHAPAAGIARLLDRATLLRLREPAACTGATNRSTVQPSFA